MRVGSLFTGAGGFDLGFQRAGWTITWQSEIDAAANRTLQHHWPDTPNHGDITRLTTGQPVDMISGGFPCQDLSVAGKRKGLDGDRSKLFHEFARIADVLHPAWITLENVPNLLSTNAGRDFWIVVHTLADIGYKDLSWRVVNTLSFGIPQHRRRLFIVGRLGTGTRTREILLDPEGSPRRPATRRRTRQETASRAARGVALRGRDHATAVELGDDTAHALTAAQGGSDRPYALVPDIARTLTTRNDRNEPTAETLVAFNARQDPDAWSDRTGPLDTDGTTQAIAVQSRIRRLTPLECERLQGFPDHWTAPAGADTHRYRLLGNAVTVPIAQWLAQRIRNADDRPGEAMMP